MVEFQGRMAIWDIERFRRLGPCSKTRRLSRNVSDRTWAPGAGAILPAWSGGRLNRLAVEPDCRENGQDDEGDQRRELGFFKWRLALRWSQHLQRRHFHKELRNQDKNIEVEGEHGRDRVGAPPRASEVPPIKSVDGDRKHYQRYDADRMGRQKAVERKQEPSHARRHRAPNKNRSPTGELFRGEQPQEYDQSSQDPDQAQQDVHERQIRHTKDHDRLRSEQVGSCSPYARYHTLT